MIQTSLLSLHKAETITRQGHTTSPLNGNDTKTNDNSRRALHQVQLDFGGSLLRHHLSRACHVHIGVEKCTHSKVFEGARFCDLIHVDNLSASEDVLVAEYEPTNCRESRRAEAQRKWVRNVFCDFQCTELWWAILFNSADFIRTCKGYMYLTPRLWSFSTWLISMLLL